MAELIETKADFGSVIKALRVTAPEVAKELQHELYVLATEVRDQTRRDVPSGMQKAAARGVRAGFLARSGAYIQAGGSSAPASWIGEAEKGPHWRHPLPRQGEDRSQWNWSKTDQPPKRMMLRAWGTLGAGLLVRSDAAIDKALRAAGWQG